MRVRTDLGATPKGGTPYDLVFGIFTKARSY